MDRSGRPGSHQTLTVWHTAVELAVECYLRTAAFPWTERAGLVMRMRRAAASVVSSIVEGHHQSDAGGFHRQLTIAKASVRELEVQFAQAASRGYVDGEAFARAQELCASTGEMLESLLGGPATEDGAHRPQTAASRPAVSDAVIH